MDVIGVPANRFLDAGLFSFPVLADLRRVGLTVGDGFGYGFEGQLVRGGALRRRHWLVLVGAETVKHSSHDPRALDEQLPISRAGFGRKEFPLGCSRRDHEFHNTSRDPSCKSAIWLPSTEAAG